MVRSAVAAVLFAAGTVVLCKQTSWKCSQNDYTYAGLQKTLVVFCHSFINVLLKQNKQGTAERAAK